MEKYSNKRRLASLLIVFMVGAGFMMVILAACTPWGVPLASQEISSLDSPLSPLNSPLNPGDNVQPLDPDSYSHHAYLPSVSHWRSNLLGTECDAPFEESTSCPVAAIAAASTGWIRLPNAVYWTETTEPSVGQYALTNTIRGYSQSIQNAVMAGITPILVIRMSPAWASAPITVSGVVTHYPCQPPTPAHYQDFANFVTQVITAFHPSVKYYEIWNEPNATPYFDPITGKDTGTRGCFGSDPSDVLTKTDASKLINATAGITYTNMMKVVYPAVKAIWPDVKIIGPALAASGDILHCSATDSPFMTYAISTGLESYVDIISYHVYEPFGTGYCDVQGEPYSTSIYKALVHNRLVTHTTPVMLDESAMEGPDYPSQQDRITQSNYLKFSYQFAITESQSLTNPLVGYIYYRAAPRGGKNSDMFDQIGDTLYPNQIYTTYLGLK